MDFYVYSDPHFGHANMLNFTRDDGTPLRPEFPDVEEMDRVMIEKFNSRVGQFEKVYFLGDVSFKLDVFHRVMPQLNGKKRLILGNHDKFKMTEYVKYFEKIYESWQPLRHVLFTHRPIHLGNHHEKIKVNIHGHTHSHSLDDKRYINMCVEKTDYFPVHWSEIEKEIASRGLSE